MTDLPLDVRIYYTKPVKVPVYPRIYIARNSVLEMCPET